MPRGVCRLCASEAELQPRHIIPVFVFRWMRDTAAGGYLRMGSEPNLRVQDGPKEYWLCAECEDRLNKFEKEFAARAFQPYCIEHKPRFRYGRWMLPFCVSVSWRVLQMHREKASFSSWAPEAISRLNEAEGAWKDVLLGKRAHPGSFEQHILPLDAIGEIRGPDIPPNINRYLMRATDTDVAHSESTEFVYS